MSANGNEESVTDEVSRSSINESNTGGNTNHGSPLTETASVTQDPTDFSVLEDDGMDDDEILETHSQNNILNSSGADNSRRYIKRPLNAYMIWTRRARDGILKANPHLKMNEVSKTMGEMWKQMADEEKKPYFKEAREKAAKHKKALEAHPELAYVPSRKKIKHKPEDLANKNDAKTPRINESPTPSTPQTPVMRQTFVHPGQSSSQAVDPNRTHSYPATNIVRTSNPAAFPGQNHVVPVYPSEFRQPAVPAQQPPYGQQQVRYVTGPPQQQVYANGVVPQNQLVVNSAFQPASIQGQSVHFLSDSRNPGGFLVRNPYVINGSEPVYEAETADLYRELYYRSLTQLQANKYGPSEKDILPPEQYLNCFYRTGGIDPPREAKSQNNSNGLVYQEL
ncbi:HMG box domain-containing protein [Aphelenchoides bicaudatus]|nr:HMG box domain-containing protein [Aphelenchoides bicaudatus]